MIIGSLTSSEQTTAIEAVFATNDVRALVANHLGVSIARVTEEAHFTDELGADWLDRLELMMAVEDQFAGVEITDADVDRIELVGDRPQLRLRPHDHHARGTDESLEAQALPFRGGEEQRVREEVVEAPAAVPSQQLAAGDEQAGDARHAAFAEAAASYDRAIALSPVGGDIYFLALYKLGWSNYMQAERQSSEEYQRAVEVFGRLVREVDALPPERQARLALQRFGDVRHGAGADRVRGVRRDVHAVGVARRPGACQRGADDERPGHAARARPVGWVCR